MPKEYVLSEIKLTRKKAGLDSDQSIYYLEPATDVHGERIYNKNIADAIEDLLRLRDAALLVASDPAPSLDTYRTSRELFRVLFGLPEEKAGGNVTAKIVIDGDRVGEIISGCSVQRMEFYRNYLPIELPFVLQVGQDLYSEIIHNDEVVGRNRLLADNKAIWVEKVEAPETIHVERKHTLSPCCHRCTKALNDEPNPPIQEAYRGIDGLPLRWMCSECLGKMINFENDHVETAALRWDPQAANMGRIVPVPAGQTLSQIPESANWFDQRGRRIMARNAATRNYAVQCADGNFLVLCEEDHRWWSTISNEWRVEQDYMVGSLSAEDWQQVLNAAPVYMGVRKGPATSADWFTREVDDQGRKIVGRNAETGNYAVQCADGRFLVLNSGGNYYWSEVGQEWTLEEEFATGTIPESEWERILRTAPATPAAHQALTSEPPISQAAKDMAADMSSGPD